MIRRMQLLGPRDRPYARRLAAVGTRIRDDLLRDNKVVPAVLATLALLVFAWLMVGPFMGGGSNDEAANQMSLAQDEEEPDSGDAAESPAPGVENRDTDSYSAFESKDPFRLLKGIESKDSENGDSKSGDTKNSGGKADNGKASVIRATVARPATMAVTMPETLGILSTSRFPGVRTLEAARVVMGVSAAAAGICRFLEYLRRDD